MMRIKREEQSNIQRVWKANAGLGSEFGSQPGFMRSQTINLGFISRIHCPAPKGASKKAEEGLSTRMCRDRIRGNDYLSLS